MKEIKETYSRLEIFRKQGVLKILNKNGVFCYLNAINLLKTLDKEMSDQKRTIPINFKKNLSVTQIHSNFYQPNFLAFVCWILKVTLNNYVSLM